MRHEPHKLIEGALLVRTAKVFVARLNSAAHVPLYSQTLYCNPGILA